MHLWFCHCVTKLLCYWVTHPEISCCSQMKFSHQQEQPGRAHFLCPAPPSSQTLTGCSPWVTWRSLQSWSSHCSLLRSTSWWSRSHCRPRWRWPDWACSWRRPWAECCSLGRRRARGLGWWFCKMSHVRLSSYLIVLFIIFVLFWVSSVSVLPPQQR